MNFQDKKMAAEITIKGKLGQDVKFTDQNSYQIANLSVMVTFGEKNEGKWENIAIWHNCTAWNELATSVKSLKKGDFVLLTGEPRKKTYTNKEGVEVVADFVNIDTIEQIEDPFNKMNIPKSPEHKAYEETIEDLPF